jgi:hypothetical protein
MALGVVRADRSAKDCSDTGYALHATGFLEVRTDQHFLQFRPHSARIVQVALKAVVGICAI